jgi:aryl-alcohol dehydrogenase-like predicted oxidoreductase
MTVIVTKAPRKLGASNINVFPVGLGCMSLSGAYGKSEDEQGIKVVHHAIDHGVTFIDSSDMYGWGHNETLLGKALAGGRRDKVVLATKFGMVSHAGDGPGNLDSSPANIRTAVEGSLRRLDTDHIDLYYQHRVDPKTPIEDVAGTLADLVAEGKIRHYGLSEAGPETIARAHAVHPVTAVQSEYSLWTRDQEPKVLPLLRELGIGLVAYSPLGRGFLTGTIRSRTELSEEDSRYGNPRFSEANFEHNLQLVGQVEIVAAAAGVTPAQVALAWLLTRGDDIAPIPGTRRVSRLEENIAADAVELTPEQIETLTELTPPAGEHHNAAQMRMIER